MGGGSSTGPIEEPFGYSKQQRPAGTLSPPRIRFPGNHLLLLEAIARHNGQVIHPLRLLARETATRPRQPLHRLHPTEENKHTPTNNRTAGGGYTPCLCTGYYTSTVCTPRVTLRPEIVPRSCKSSSTTTFLLTIAVSFLFHRILPLLANRDPLDHPSLPPLPPFVTDRGTEHSDSIQLGVERRRKIFLLDERLRSISISGFEDHFKLENSIF